MTSDETIRKDVMIESLALRLWDEGLLRPEWQAVQVVTALLGWLEEDGMLAPAPLLQGRGTGTVDTNGILHPHLGDTQYVKYQTGWIEV